MLLGVGEQRLDAEHAGTSWLHRLAALGWELEFVTDLLIPCVGELWEIVLRICLLCLCRASRVRFAHVSRTLGFVFYVLFRCFVYNHWFFFI